MQIPLNVSILICTYNRADSLGITLQSLSGVIVPKGVTLETLIVDNNSKDGTREIVERFNENYKYNLKYILEAEQGLSSARNAGLKEATGDIILFTDDDVLVDPAWLTEIVHAFCSYNADCVGGKILPVWPCERPSWLTRKIEGNIALLDYGEGTFEIEDENRLLFGANIAFSRRILQRVGCFDTSLGRKGDKLYSHEDKELYKRVIQAHGKVIYSSRAIIHHIIGMHRTRKSYFRKWHFDDGEFHGIQLGNYDKRNIFGIPFYIIRGFIEISKKYLISMLSLNSEMCFIDELNVCNSLGFMNGRLKLYFGKDPKY